MEISNGEKVLKLESWQVPHFKQVENIITKNYCYIDTSVMGSGKSYIVAGLAIKYGFSLGIICPKTVISVWSTITSEYNIPVHFLLSYQKLRSIAGKNPKHELLERINSTKVMFRPTDLFISMARSGLFLILDEIQYIKNDSDQYKACQTLTSTCLSIGGSCRFALLSGTPFDKEEHAVNLLRLIGYIQNDKLYEYRKDLLELKLLGAQELIDICIKMNPEKTQYVLENYPIDRKNVPGLCYKLYIEVIKSIIISAMPPPKVDSEKDVKNGYYKLSRDGSYKLEQAIRDLSRASKYNPITKDIDCRKPNWRDITKAHMNIENIKLEILIRLTHKQLQQDPQCKIIIFVNYVNSIKTLHQELMIYQPAIMYGSTCENDRDKVINDFKNDENLRLLIANTKVGGIGTSLDDKFGNHPRYTYIIPTYNILDLHQATYRTYRHGTKSKATIRFIYGKINLRETSILNALSRKAHILRSTLDAQCENGICFPGEFDDEYESDS